MMSSDRMRPLTYVLTESADAGRLVLREAQAPALHPSAWQNLAAHVAREASLTPFPAQTLRERWEQGYAALLVQGDEIAAYVSLVPVFSAVTRQVLAEVLDVPMHRMPAIEVYESMTGWTAQGLRKQGISLHLRQPLLARFERPDRLFIGFTAGLGASPVLARLGWQVAPWSQISYVGSIIENSMVDCESGTPHGWHVQGLTPYDGPPILPYSESTAERDWTRTCYFWISNANLAHRLDHRLSVLVGSDVCRWRGIWGQVVERALLDQGWVPIVRGVEVGAGRSAELTTKPCACPPGDRKGHPDP